MLGNAFSINCSRISRGDEMSSVQRFFKHMIMSSNVLFVFPASQLQIPSCVEICR